MSQIAINTSQNININFGVASLGERILAFAIDMLIKIAYIIILFVLIFHVLGLSDNFRSLDRLAKTAIISFLTLPFYFYTLVLESLLEGQTFGKKIMQIKVVKIDGYQASFSDYLIRWLFRLVEVFATSGVVALISVIISNKSQRLGDMVSGTAIISLKNKVNISHTILEDIAEDYIPRFSQVIALNDNDMRIIKENFYKAQQTKDVVVLAALADKIKTVIKVEKLPNELTEEEFIDIVLKDYNYYTGS